MTFDSMAFLVFLPIVMLVHWLLPHRFRWMLLLGASYLFYAWWNVELMFLILTITALSYFAGRMLERTPSVAIRKFWLIVTLLVSLGLLGYFKYFNLLGRTVTAVFTLLGGNGRWNALDIILPVGISFYTFQAMSYVIDVYRRDLQAERHLGYYALYISFFPQLVAGPIERAGSLLPQIRAERHMAKDDITAGCRLLISGFYRKLVVADLCAPLVNAVYDAPNPDGAAVLIATLLFAAQIYCDFAGYSEIALGAARLLGVNLMQNFNSPYGAKSVRDFWRRWHISLSIWFTDYVYIPIGGNRKGLQRQLLATFAVFTLSGLWHGAEWSFVVWGLLHACYMAVELLGRSALANHGKTLPPCLSHIITFAAVCFAWIFFRANTMTHAIILVKAVFSPWHLDAAMSLFETLSLNSGGITILIVLILFALLLMRKLPSLTNGEQVQDMTYVFFLLAIALAWFIRTQSGGGNAFIYFQF